MFAVMSGVYVLVTKFLIAPLIDKKAEELRSLIDERLEKFAAAKEVEKLQTEIEKLDAEIVALKLAIVKRRR